MSDLRHAAPSKPHVVRTETDAESSPASKFSDPHLSESQIDDYIIGDLSAAIVCHLAACPLCADRVAVASSDLTSFKDLSTTWSERRSAALPTLSQRNSAWQKRVAWQQRMAIAAPCLVLLAGLAVIRSSYGPGLPPQSPDPNAALLDQQGESPTARQSRLSADDRMLDAIDAYVNSDSDTPADLGIKTVDNSSRPPSTPSSVQD